MAITGQPWAECFICGFDFPQNELRRHYKKGTLVCFRCDDKPGHDDYVEKLAPPVEEPTHSLQPVRDQGEV